MCNFPAKELIEAERKWSEYDSVRPGEGGAKNNITLPSAILLLEFNHVHATGCQCVQEAREQVKHGKA